MCNYWGTKEEAAPASCWFLHPCIRIFIKTLVLSCIFGYFGSAHRKAFILIGIFGIFGFLGGGVAVVVEAVDGDCGGGLSPAARKPEKPK